MIDFLSSPFSLVSVGLGVLAIAIIGIVAWILSIDRRTRGMVDSLEQERRKVAEMQVFLSRRGNDGARRTPRAPQSGAAVGARSAAAAGGEAPAASQGAGRAAAPGQATAGAASMGAQRRGQGAQAARFEQEGMGQAASPQTASQYPAGQQGRGQSVSPAVGQSYAVQAQASPQAGAMPHRAAQPAAGRYGAASSTVVPTGQSAAGAAYFQATAGANARSMADAARAAAGVPQAAPGASKPEKQRSRGGRGAVKVPYGEDKTGGAGYAGLDQSSDARARAEQAARIRQQAAREAQMRAQQQAQASAAYGAQAAVAGGGYAVAARGGAVTGQAASASAAAPTDYQVAYSPSASASASAATVAQGAGYAAASVQAAGAVSPSVQTPAGVRYVPSDPNYRPASEGPRVKAHPTHPDGFDGTVRTFDTHGRPEGSSAQTPYDQRSAQRPVNPAEGKPSMPWSTPAEPRGRHAR